MREGGEIIGDEEEGQGQVLTRWRPIEPATDPDKHVGAELRAYTPIGLWSRLTGNSRPHLGRSRGRAEPPEAVVRSHGCKHDPR